MPRICEGLVPIRQRFAIVTVFGKNYQCAEFRSDFPQEALYVKYVFRILIAKEIQTNATYKNLDRTLRKNQSILCCVFLI